MQIAAPAGGRLVAGVILGFVLAHGFGFASELSKDASSTAAALPPHDDGVLVTTDKRIYQPGDTIVVEVSNRLDTAITTRDQRFQCTIIALEQRRADSGEWREIRNCFSGAPVSEVTLEPGSSTTIRIESSGGPSGGLEPGFYRAALDYSRGGRLSLAPGSLLVARSEDFQIQQ